jgi:hypothetical protein
MGSDCYKAMPADRWNACLEVISRPLETLDAIQHPAALVFEYYGRVMNGGHSLHFDVHGDASDPQLLQALRHIAAASHARILAECYFLRREARDSRSDEDYVAETIEDLDGQFYRLEPEILELLARYFQSHPESFPV